MANLSKVNTAKTSKHTGQSPQTCSCAGANCVFVDCFFVHVILDPRSIPSFHLNLKSPKGSLVTSIFQLTPILTKVLERTFCFVLNNENSEFLDILLRSNFLSKSIIISSPYTYNVLQRNPSPRWMSKMECTQTRSNIFWLENLPTDES